MDKYCMFKNELEINDLLDGRTISFVAEEVHISRGLLSKYLRRLKACTIGEARKIVTRCKSENVDIENYFDIIVLEK